MAWKGIGCRNQTCNSFGEAGLEAISSEIDREEPPLSVILLNFTERSPVPVI